jgi:hypothetical protein
MAACVLKTVVERGWGGGVAAADHQCHQTAAGVLMIIIILIRCVDRGGQGA